MRAVAGGGEIVGGDVVNLVLPMLHARDVIGERYGLRIVAVVGGGDADQLQQALAIGEVFAEPFLEHTAERTPECRVFFLLRCIVAVGQILQQAQNLFHAAGFDRFHVLRFLKNFARNVERQIVGINHAFHKSQIAGQQMFGVVHDEYAPHVKLHAVLGFAVKQVEWRLARQVQEFGVFVAAFDARMCPRERLFPIVRDVFVEFLVLGFGDVRFGSRPQCACLVDGFLLIFFNLGLLILVPLGFLHRDRHLDVIGIFADDGFQAIVVKKFFRVFLQMQSHFRAACGFIQSCQREFTIAGTRPEHAFARRVTPGAGAKFNPVGDDERRVKTDAELADQVGILLLVTGQFRKKFLGAGFGDGADV